MQILMPERKGELTFLFWRSQPYEVKVFASRRCVSLADLDAVFYHRLIDAGSLDQHWVAALEHLNAQVYHFVDVARARILNDKGAHVPLEELTLQLIIQGNWAIWLLLQVSSKDAAVMRTSHILELRDVYIVWAGRRSWTAPNAIVTGAAEPSVVVPVWAPEILVHDALLALMRILSFYLLESPLCSTFCHELGRWFAIDNEWLFQKIVTLIVLFPVVTRHTTS